MTDEELIARAKDDPACFGELAERFGPLIKSEKSRALRRNPDFSGEADEFGQEALMALYDAVKTFDAEKNVTFGSYAKVCIRNRIISYVRKLGAEARRQRRAEEKAKNRENAENPEDLLLALEGMTKFGEALDRVTTAYEKRVLTLYISKKSVKETANELGKDEKSVSNALYRARTKLKKLFL